jgi:hypothetical protein
MSLETVSLEELVFASGQTNISSDGPSQWIRLSVTTERVVSYLLVNTLQRSIVFCRMMRIDRFAGGVIASDTTVTNSGG